MDGMPDNATVPEAKASGVTSGTASEALIAAATAASSAEESAAPGAGGAPAGESRVVAGVVVPPDTAAATTAQPTGTEKPAVGTEAPQSRIEAAVRNARAEVEKQYEWAKGFTPNDVNDIKSAVNLVQSIKQDSVGFGLQLLRESGVPIDELIEAAKATKAKASERKPFALPKADLRSEDGKGAYSDEAMAGIVKGLMDEFDFKMSQTTAPLLKRNQSIEQQEKAQEREQSILKLTKQTAEKMRKLPHVTPETEKVIIAKVQAMDPRYIMEIGPIAAMHEAYAAMLQESVFPTIDASAEQRVRAENDKKAATSRGSAHPVSSGSERGSADIKGVTGLAKHMEELEKKMATA